jgi:hypothetical protein
MRVTVVRPYGDDIRQRMFRALEQAGLAPRPDDVIPAGTVDRVVLAVLRTRPEHVLVVPFNAQRDHEGKRTNGLQLLQQLDAETAGAFPWPVLMPVSRYGAAAAHLMLAESERAEVSPRLRERVLLIDEEDLADPRLAGRIRDHVQRWRTAA